MRKSFLIAALAYTLVVLLGNPIEQNHPLEDPLTTKAVSSASLKSEAALKAPAITSITASANIPAAPVVASVPAPVTYIAPVASSTTGLITFTSAAQAKAYIYQHESGNNPASINQSSGACGLGQALPCSKLPCSLSDYSCQDAWFTTYAITRYGSWINAANFWQNHHWW